MRNRSWRWITLCWPMLAILASADLGQCAEPSQAEGAGDVPLFEGQGGGAGYQAASKDYARASQLAVTGDARCVDWYVSSALGAWEDLHQGLMQDPPRLWHGTLALYNSAVMSAVVQGHRLGRLDPALGLRVSSGDRWRTIPIVGRDLNWRLHQIDCLRPAATNFPDPRYAETVRYGVGAALIGIHYRRPEIPGERHYLEQHPLAITAVLGIDPSTGSARIEFHNPVGHQTIHLAGKELTLTRNIAGALHFALERLLADVDPISAFLNPQVAVNYEGLLMLQPYQRGKIPVVLVHGLLSNPATWGPLINVLLNNPELMERFQIWGYLYPTGVSLLRTASELRKDLRNTVSFLDPAGADPALQEMVLIGHSMGGLLSRLQVTWSGNHLWEEFSNMPFGQVRGDQSQRQLLAEMFFFGPQPFVTRVVFMATPHQGSEWNACVLGCLGRTFAGRPPLLVALWDAIRRLNPNALRGPFSRGLPSSLDSLAASSPFVRAMNRLPFSSRVRLHSVIGTGGCKPCCRGDGLVSIESARLLGVESELFVEAPHNDVKEHPETIREVERILWVHWSAFAERQPLRAPTNLDAVPAPAPANDRLPFKSDYGLCTPTPIRARHDFDDIELAAPELGEELLETQRSIVSLRRIPPRHSLSSCVTSPG